MSQSGFDTKIVKELAKILRDSDLNEIEIEHEGTKIRVSKQSNLISAPQNYQQIVAAPSPANIGAPSMDVKPVESAPVSALAAVGNAVTSPMVGTIYFSPEQNAKPFISVGDTVEKGQQLFIVEAMKTLNAVTSEFEGVVKAILVRDAHPVEFGEQLCIIE